MAGCVLQYLPDNQLEEEGRTFWGWNLGRDRAVDALADVDLPDAPDASGDPCAPVYEEFDQPSGTASARPCRMSPSLRFRRPGPAVGPGAPRASA